MRGSRPELSAAVQLFPHFVQAVQCHACIYQSAVKPGVTHMGDSSPELSAVGRRCGVWPRWTSTLEMRV